MTKGDAETRQPVLVLAQVGFDLRGLKRELREAGFELVTMGKVVGLSSTIVESLTEAVQSASLILVIADGHFSSNQLFEAGFATAIGRPVVIASRAGSAEISRSLAGALVLTYDPANLESLVEAIRRLAKPTKVAAPKHESTRPEVSSIPFLGNARTFEMAVATAIQRTGVEVISQFSYDRGFDLAVYSTDLEFVVGNPLLVEVRHRLPSNSRQVIDRLAHSAFAIRVPWVLLVHGSGVDTPIAPGTPPNVLVMPFELLGEAPERGQFVDLVRQLRNRAAHGLEQ